MKEHVNIEETLRKKIKTVGLAKTVFGLLSKLSI